MTTRTSASLATEIDSLRDKVLLKPERTWRDKAESLFRDLVDTTSDVSDSYGLITVSGSADIQNIDDSAYVLYTGYDTNGPSGTGDVSPDQANNQITIGSGTYEVHFGSSFSGTVNTRFDMKVVVTGSIQNHTASAANTLGSGADDVSNINISDIIESTGSQDAIQIHVISDDSGGADLSIIDSQLTVVKLSS